jgi:hypothetical protein
MRPIRPVLVLMTILGFIGIFSIACKQGAGRVSARGGGSSDARVTESEQSLSAILFVNELSCPCTREQCHIAEGIVETLKEDFSWGVRFETIDYELQNEKAKPLMQKYSTIDIPFLLVLDGERFLWKCNDFSDEKAVRARFEELVLAALNVKKE